MNKITILLLVIASVLMYLGGRCLFVSGIIIGAVLMLYFGLYLAKSLKL